MINSVLRYILVFIILILIQILVLNNIQFSGYVNPYIYIMMILLLPVEISPLILLFVSFLTGLTVDFFTGSTGMHAGATVFAGFVRPYVLRILSPRDGYEPGARPSMAVYGFRWFFIYSLVIVSVHHLVLFYLEVFRLDDFFRTLLRVVISTVFTLSIILLAEFYRKGK